MKIIVENLAIEYADQGVGKTLLFLHGWQDNLHTFDEVANILDISHRIIRLDLPGFGKSEMPREAWDVDRYAQFVLSFVIKLNLKVDGIVGHSFGGRITVKSIAREIMKPEKIVLIGSAGVADKKILKKNFFSMVAKVGKTITFIPPLYFFRDSLRRKMYSHVGRDYANSGELRDTFVKIINEDLTDDAKRIQLPALLIWGKNDTETPVREGEKFARLIANSKLEVIEHAGHFVHREKSKQVADLISDFYA